MIAVILRGGSVDSDTPHGVQSFILRRTRRGYCYSGTLPVQIEVVPLRRQVSQHEPPGPSLGAGQLQPGAVVGSTYAHS